VAELTGLAGVATDVMDALGEIGVGVLVLAENVFPPIPSEVVLPLAGYLASRGRMDLTLVIVAATVGSVLGALLLYEAGVRTGRVRLRRFIDWMPLLEGEDLDKAEAWFARHGQASVLFGRCIPVVRSLISVPAGFAEMPRWRFLLLTAIGSGVWNAVFVGTGYALGSQFDQVERYSGWLNTAVYAAIAVLLVLGLRRALRRRRAEKSGSAEKVGSAG
jgi:membrane protein DedA with SNARE-associated domain